MMLSQGGIRLIAGLGNPGSRYQNNRHNAGYWFVDYLVNRYQARFKEQAKFKGASCRIEIGGQILWLFKPRVFMNESGIALVNFSRFHKLDTRQILIAHDEIDFPLAKLRLKYGGGHGGHNGLSDIIRHLDNEFWRLRIGIGHPGNKQRVVSHVLGDSNRQERETIQTRFDELIEPIAYMVAGEFQKAMERLHREP